MDYCPHCGEALNEHAEACPHCGSDFETGWKPDSDDYGLELPDDEVLESDHHLRPVDSVRENLIHVALVLASAVVFVASGADVYDTVLLPFLVPLPICMFLYYRWINPEL